MKKFITNKLMILLLLFGCNPDSNVTSPDDSTTQSQLKLIQLPALKGHSIETSYTKSKYINGHYGGNFTEQFSCQSSIGYVSISSQIVFPAGSFYGSKTITQTFNTKTASLEFGPEMQFDHTVKYTFTISGVDLTGINPETLDFVYVAQDGSITGCVYDSIYMDTASRTLKVTNAQLNHFSRYGFVN